MARDKFFADIRRAVSWMTPQVEADSPTIDISYIEKMLHGTDLWMSKNVIEEFRPEDFANVNERDRGTLITAVNDFKRITKNVNPQKPARPDQRAAAIPAFSQIVHIVQRLVLEDWVRASDRLISDAETWAKEEGWPTALYPKTITEDFIGNYSLSKLVYSAEGSQLALIPVGRFAPGTDGMFDLAVMPAYDSVTVVRKRTRWFVNPLSGEDEIRLEWARPTFRTTSLKLARLP